MKNIEAIFDGDLILNFQWLNRGYKANSIKTMATRFILLLRAARFFLANARDLKELEGLLPNLSRDFLDKSQEAVRCSGTKRFRSELHLFIR